jgi:hypothetical protein
MSVATAVYPSPRELRALIRRRRRTRNRRPFGGSALDLYVALLGVLLLGAVVLSPSYESLRDTTLPTALDLPGVGQWLVVSLAVLAVAGGVRLLGDLGPVVVGPAVQFWLLATPVNQRGLLLPRLLAQTLVGATVGAVCGWCVGRLLDLHPARPTLLAIGLAVTAHSWATLAQASGSGARTWRRWTNTLLVLTTLAVLALVAAGRYGVRLAAPPWNGTTAAVAALALAVLTTVVAVVRLDRLTREALGQVDLMDAAGSAIAMMDPGSLASVLDTRRWRRIGRVRSRRLGGTGLGTMLRADLLRQVRKPSGLVWWCVLLLVPHLAAALDLTGLPPMTLATVVAAVATGRLARGLREVCRSVPLRHALGVGDGRVHLVHLVVPAMGATAFVGVCGATGVAGLSWPVAAIAVVAAVAVVYRRATMPPPVWTGAYVDTPFGVIPADLVPQVLRGPLLLSVALLAQLYLGHAALG